MRFAYSGAVLVLPLALVGFAAVLPAQVDPPDIVYFSNETQILSVDLGEHPGGCIDDPTCLTPILPPMEGASFEGLNGGPDGLLYFCDPANGIVGRTSVTGGTSEVFYDFNDPTQPSPGPAQPQCGWFTHLLDFIVTDKASGEIYAFEGIGDPDFFVSSLLAPTPIVVPNLGPGGLDGLVQYIDGTLLVARPGAKKVKGDILRVGFPGFLPDQGASSQASTFRSNLKGPSGLSISNGYVFATSDDGLSGYDWLGNAKLGCDLGNKFDPTHVAATVDGRLYVALTGKNSGRVVEFTPVYNNDGELVGCGSPRVIAQVLVKDGYSKEVGGVAVTPGSVTVQKISGDFSEFPVGSGRYEAAFEFNSSNVWEFSAGPDCSQATITGFLSTLGAVQDAIDVITVDENGQGISNPLDSRPVTFFGDNGHAWIWRLGPDEVWNCPVGPDGFYRHLVYGYSPFLGNGRIGVCPDASDLPNNPSDPPCAFMELTIAVNANQDLTTEDPLGGRRGRRSDYFWVDQATDKDVNPGVWCGFESPVNNTRTSTGVPVADPNPSEFGQGGNIALKGRLAEVTGYVDNEPDQPIFDCQNGPFIKEMGTPENRLGPLLSVARVDATTGDLLEVKKQLFPNGAGQSEPAYFDSLQNATGQWHYNLDSGNLEPGWYEIWVAFPLDNTEVVVTDIVIN